MQSHELCTHVCMWHNILSHYFNNPFDFCCRAHAHTHTQATSNSFQFTLTALLNCNSGKSLNISEIHRHAMLKSLTVSLHVLFKRTHTHIQSHTTNQIQFSEYAKCVCSVRRQWFCHSSCSKQCQWGKRPSKCYYCLEKLSTKMI